MCTGPWPLCMAARVLKPCYGALCPGASQTWLCIRITWGSCWTHLARSHPWVSDSVDPKVGEIVHFWHVPRSCHVVQGPLYENHCSDPMRDGSYCESEHVFPSTGTALVGKALQRPWLIWDPPVCSFHHLSMPCILKGSEKLWGFFGGYGWWKYLRLYKGLCPPFSKS